ncbi:hypothetical protein EYZ11_003978 [Aspergillus tanneri]|uniref:BZIP domain-containing protein n=1 Tax=Aspergillus tanneri TaxID=1220188 RepID=A0A4V3UPU5_9EURO|nr:uncharacterized protein ATNIH1004_000677 [Aspergillus tanneri]KAA8651781.1 hypothetical protein ATNIH1004_000677 [Aspergillus tanneri]THC96534.1 hypothetical protein EYZ11_003978 [Aspergillus tanneri]
MANRLPPLNDVAPSPAMESLSMSQEEEVKIEEDSPTPTGLASSADAETETPASDHNGGPAGRKRKLNSTSARGVANLTPEQLAKKRANDRQAQRAIRERTKSHIDSLEQRVRELSSQKPFLDLQAALKQNELIQAENRELKQGLKAIMDIIHPLIGKNPSNPPSVPPTGPKCIPPISTTLPFVDSIPPNINLSRSADQPYSESIAGAETPSSTHSAPALGTIRRNSSSASATSFRIAFDYQRQNLTHGLDFGTDERMGFNFLLDASQQVPRVEGFRRSSENFRPPPLSAPAIYPPPPHQGPMAEHPLPAHLTLVRNIAPTCTLDAILLDFLHHRQQEAAQGVPKQKLVGPPYPSVSSLLNPEKSVYSHPLSKVFTDILRSFPDISSLPEQVAVLYSMFVLMRWQIYPTQENYDRIPEWLTPRPSQLFTPHPAWIDYLPWPRMRDRVVMAYRDYPFESWYTPFTSTLCVNWPYDATDCLLSTGDSDELIINPVFERHFRNLNNWTLGPAFAEVYPSLVETTKIKPTP